MRSLEELSREINNLCGEQERIAAVKKWINREHRTLQQSLMREVVMPLIKEWAMMFKDDRYDLRNEQTVVSCSKIVEMIEQKKEQGFPEYLDIFPMV